MLDASAVEAYARADVDLHPSFAPVDTAWSRWRNLATPPALLGRLDAAEALLVALDAGCDVPTADPEAYSSLGDDPPVIGV